jgi:hypothetical protein
LAPRTLILRALEVGIYICIVREREIDRRYRLWYRKI